MAFTRAGKRTAICCLAQNEWRLDVATGSFFQKPGLFHQEFMSSSVDRWKLEQLYNRYKGKGRRACWGVPEAGAVACGLPILLVLSCVARLFK